MKVPFYAQLLSKQEISHMGGSTATKPANDEAQTQKYPSDQEDTNPLADQPHTLKYPSDQEDATQAGDAG